MLMDTRTFLPVNGEEFEAEIQTKMIHDSFSDQHKKNDVYGIMITKEENKKCYKV